MPTSPPHILEHAIHSWSAYLVPPVFGFANAGVSLVGFTPPLLLDPVTLGLAFGLLASADAPTREAEVEIGVTVGSVACMIAGALGLLVAAPGQRRARPVPA
ncbi:Na+/H+ antiporter NhaA [Methylobacterium sp. IF7SW-B2]|nr:Na+/H+ antiporter NhaA [Methylobacterium ajmalii]MBK3406862.1 Na+/H+ antiporter NhaA [Methylobacterium ajmalii]MBK3420647.1 Na+/H+ antiporter NhaA [Methylobacterium ajmalii]